MHVAVAELYRIFGAYRLGDFSGCSHCVSPRDSERLASTPLHELDVGDLNHYAFKAMTTWGTDGDFKHFLPRLFELALDSYTSFEFPETLLGKLTLAKWITWPTAERDAVESFLSAFWEHHLRLPGGFPGDDRIRTVLGGLAEACESVAPYLRTWENTQTENSAMHLAQLIESSAQEIMTKGRIRLWSETTAQCDQIVRWLQGDGARRILMQFWDAVLPVFPLTLGQLDGIRAAILSGS